MYKQCKLRKGKATITTWAHVNVAKKGKQIMVKRGNFWEFDWIIEEVYHDIVIDEDRLDELKSDHRNQRKVSDV